MVLMTLFLACGEKEAECSEELACEFGSVCVEGVCEEIPCSTSAQCGMEEYCLDRQCVSGCAEDNDCYPGDLCNTTVNECESGGCRDTQLDCGFKEFCNPANAECYEVDGYYCKPTTARLASAAFPSATSTATSTPSSAPRTAGCTTMRTETWRRRRAPRAWTCSRPASRMRASRNDCAARPGLH